MQSVLPPFPAGVGSPSLRGSGLKCPFKLKCHKMFGSPSLRGSGLKLLNCRHQQIMIAVSLFTREWIEIMAVSPVPCLRASPSLRGSGLKFGLSYPNQRAIKSPSLRGSGLKSLPVLIFFDTLTSSPSLRGSGLK